MPDELLDLVNEKDEVVGTVLKSLAHKDANLIHREIAVLIFNKREETLLQQRSSKKKTDPLKWGIACAGHVSVGEAPEEAAKRELREELGIESELIFFDKLFSRDSKHNESKFHWIYYGFYEGNDFLLDKEEVEAIQWVRLSELGKFYENIGSNLQDISYTTAMKIAKNLNLYK